MPRTSGAEAPLVRPNRATRVDAKNSTGLAEAPPVNAGFRMAELFSAEFTTALLQVILIDLVLAGDNAIVIGLAAAGLARPISEQSGRARYRCGDRAAHPLCRDDGTAPEDRRAAIRWRPASPLGLLEDVATSCDSRSSMRRMRAWRWPAPMELWPRPHRARPFVRQPCRSSSTDVSMSLDNVLAVAGAAREHPAVLVFGLGLSIILMGMAASIIARLLARHRWIAYVGLAIIPLHGVWYDLAGSRGPVAKC